MHILHRHLRQNEKQQFIIIEKNVCARMERVEIEREEEAIGTYEAVYMSD